MQIMEGASSFTRLSLSLYVYLLIIGTYGIFFWRFILRRGLVDSLTHISMGGRRKALAGEQSFLYWFSPILFLALWGVASSTGIASTKAVPSPGGVLLSFWRLLKSGTLLTEASISFSRIIIGFFFASTVGTVLGMVAGAFLVGRQLIAPVNSFLRYIPPTAFIVLLIVYFGVDETFKYAVVFLGVIFFIIQMIIDAVDDIDARYIEIALTSGSSNWGIFKNVILPSSWPRVLDVLRINLSAAWTFLVAAELVGAERGLGHFIAISQRFLRLEDVYAGIMTFGIIGFLTDFGLELLSHRLFRWYYVALKR
ncbi:MAG: ABC transporter permease [Acidobacteriota bacterium]|nr:ABC transporter permease [Acidobacteriota bacterium]